MSGEDGKSEVTTPKICGSSDKYRTIVGDPPWHYDEFGTSPTSRRAAPKGDGKRAPRPLPYPSLPVEEIAALPVATLAADDSVLFLWTTSKYLPEAFSVLRAWGFRYGQTLVWRKTGNPTPFGGVVAPNHAEFVLVGKRGHPQLKRERSSVLEAPAPQVGRHSTKPEAFLDLVERCSAGPYLELFARRQRLGWDTWGNEAFNHVELGMP